MKKEKRKENKMKRTIKKQGENKSSKKKKLRDEQIKQKVKVIMIILDQKI